MAIPKIIHYCWFGHNPKPKLALKCMKSWKKYCPDYEIIEWNEDNFDISSCPLYVRQAYEVKKWSFVTDYVRLKVVYEHGGIYLDTDVELKKSLDSLLDYAAYFGFEDGVCIATGLGFGAIKGHGILKEMMNDYEKITFILEDGTYNWQTCPKINTDVFLKHGLKQDNSFQVLDNGVLVLPTEYLGPMEYESRRLNITPKTISVHWYSSQWLTGTQIRNRARVARQIRRNDAIHRLLHIPNRVLIRLLGKEKYEQLKRLLKRDGS